MFQQLMAARPGTHDKIAQAVWVKDPALRHRGAREGWPSRVAEVPDTETHLAHCEATNMNPLKIVRWRSPPRDGSAAEVSPRWSQRSTSTSATHEKSTVEMIATMDPTATTTSAAGRPARASPPPMRNRAIGRLKVRMLTASNWW